MKTRNPMLNFTVLLGTRIASIITEYNGPSCDRRGILGRETYSTDARGVRIFKFKYLSTRIGQLDYCTAEY